MRPWASCGQPLALGLERVVDRGLQLADLLLGLALLVALALLELLVHALGLGRDDLAQSGRRLAAALLAFADDDLAGRLERDRALRRPGAELREARLDRPGRR